MNYPLQNNREYKQFPVYSLFPNHTTSKIGEHSENLITNLPLKLIQNGSSRPSSKLAPIGTGRPSSNRNCSGQTRLNVDVVRTYQSTLQMENRQRFLTTSNPAISGQIFSPFNQTQWAYLPTSMAHQQFFSMNPVGIIPSQQNHSDGSTISNVDQLYNKNRTAWTPLPVDGLPKLFVSNGQSQLYMWNLERYVNEKAIQGFNNNCTNQNLINPHPFPEAYNAMAIPKRAIDVFPSRAIDVLSGQEIHGYGPMPRQDYGLMPKQDNGSVPRQDYGPMPRQDYGLIPRQDYGPMPRQDYGLMPRQDYGPMPRQDYGLMPKQNYGPMPRQDYGLMPSQDYDPMPRQDYGSMARHDGGVINIEGNNHNGNKQTTSAKQQILNPKKETEGGAQTKDSYKNKTRRHIFYNSNYGRRRHNNNKS